MKVSYFYEINCFLYYFSHNNYCISSNYSKLRESTWEFLREFHFIKRENTKRLFLHAMSEASTRIAIVDGEKVNEMINFLYSSVNHPDVIWNVESIVLL